jgi:Zn-dependent protease/CBS domain-containing protein
MNGPRRSRWSWQLGSLFGISIRVHITLIVLLAWVAIAAPIAGAGARQAFAQWVLVVAVFGCIVVHELAHALVARRFGCPTREILLLPIGGIAQMERMPERPAQELLVALVGPAANLVIALVLGGFIGLAGWPIDPEQPASLGAIIVPLFWSNIALAVFNLLPAFPMDGGRVLRAALASRMGRARATRAAGRVGKVLAVVFVFAGLTFGATMLALIGLFVWFTAEQESATVMLSTLLSKATVADAMIRTPHLVDAQAPLDDVAAQMLAEGRREIVVSDQGRVTGVVTAPDLAARLAMPRPHGAVGSAIHRDVPVVAPTTPLDAVLEPLGRWGVVLVGERDLVLGVLTDEQVAMFAALHQPAG